MNVNAILSSLHYTAGSGGGSDTISFDVWNQAGTETTGTTAVMIDPPTMGASMTMAEFAAPATRSLGGNPMLPTNNQPSGSMLLTPPDQPMSMPLIIPHG